MVKEVCIHIYNYIFNTSGDSDVMVMNSTTAPFVKVLFITLIYIVKRKQLRESSIEESRKWSYKSEIVLSDEKTTIESFKVRARRHSGTRSNSWNGPSSKPRHRRSGRGLRNFALVFWRCKVHFVNIVPCWKLATAAEWKSALWKFALSTICKTSTA